MKNIVILIQITGNEPPISGLQVGGVAAPDTVAICGSETVTFTATDGNHGDLHIDGNPVGARSDNLISNQYPYRWTSCNSRVIYYQYSYRWRLFFYFTWYYNEC